MVNKTFMFHLSICLTLSALFIILLLLLIFYLGDFGERGTTSEKNKAFSSHMGEATWKEVDQTNARHYNIVLSAWHFQSEKKYVSTSKCELSWKYLLGRHKFNPVSELASLTQDIRKLFTF